MVGKPALVMVPALGCDAELYEEVAAGLAYIVVPQTIVCDGDTIRACVEQVLATAPSEFVILGTSFGGRVALETALAAPGRVKGLWIIGAGPGRVADPAAGRERSHRIRGGEFEAVIAEMAEKAVYDPGPNGAAARGRALRMLGRIDPERMARQSDAMAARGDVAGRLGEIVCPALMLWGSKDQFSNPPEGLAMAAALPNARYVEIPDCGHFPTLEAPAETLDAARHWLRSIPFRVG
jgi:pimeloyl-ACP methyl ester carboxylesterase